MVEIYNAFSTRGNYITNYIHVPQPPPSPPHLHDCNIVRHVLKRRIELAMQHRGAGTGQEDIPPQHLEGERRGAGEQLDEQCGPRRTLDSQSYPSGILIAAHTHEREVFSFLRSPLARWTRPSGATASTASSSGSASRRMTPTETVYTAAA